MMAPSGVRACVATVCTCVATIQACVASIMKKSVKTKQMQICQFHFS